MRENTDIIVKICDDSPECIEQNIRGHHSFQLQSPGHLCGAVLKGRRRVKRTRRRHRIRKTGIAPKPTLRGNLQAGVPYFTASSSSDITNSSLKLGLLSTKQAQGRTKMCTRVLLPSALFIVLLGIVSFLWIPPRHARRPYSSLDDYSDLIDIKTHSGSSNELGTYEDRRLNSNKKYRVSLESSIGRCYDKGGPNLCSKPDACTTKHSLLCKCTCLSSKKID